MAILTSSMQTFTDLTDQRRLSCYLTANLPTVQIKDPNTNVLNPDWTKTNLIITPALFIENDKLGLTDSGVTIQWQRRDGSGTDGNLVSGEAKQTDGTLKVNSNVLSTSSSKMLTYTCKITYYDTTTEQNVNIQSSLSFSLIQNATNARLVSITADSFVFKYDKNQTIMSGSTNPITLTADAQGVSINKWQYKNSNSAWVDYPTTNENSNITSSTLKVKDNHAIFVGNTATIRILTNDNNVVDTITLTKIYDGATGAVGAGGISVICGNEAALISCNSSGAADGAQNISIPFYAFKGTTQIACSIAVSGLPSGMTISTNTAATASAAGNLVLNVASGSTLGGATKGEVTLTYTADGNTIVKKFSWSKSIKGATGASSVILTLTTPKGSVIANGSGTLDIQSILYEGATEVTSGVTYKWYTYSTGDWSVVSGKTAKNITVTADEIINITSFKCEATYKTKTYTAVVTLMDKTDPCVSEMIALGGTIFKNGLGGTAVYTIVRRGGEEIDQLLGPVKEVAPANPKSGDFWWCIDTSNKDCILKKYDGSKWVNATEKQNLYYYYFKRDKDGNDIESFEKDTKHQKKVIYFDADDVDSIATLQCNISDEPIDV